ncbi:uncharacterized protein LOC131634729 [Vicia villosa]|uniref:uncharacterized protein LOC131634729 n=1 Tax=Vicia villosa TaxID=3911 RepID=UPI00273B5D29|nr:uncharacterized protein LOC131634729 [Vicia villosa]
MVFCRGDSKSVKAISDLLKDYGSYSGQHCNCTKSLIYAGGMSQERHKYLADIIGFSRAVPPFIYLGVPIFVGRPKAGNTEKKNIVTVAWKVCCKHKNEGGLGILSLKDYNHATNIYLCWKFMNDNQNWSQVLKARVLRNGRIIKCAIKSSIWHGIKEAYGTVMENCIWSVGSGRRVNFWIDNWLREPLVNTFHINAKYHFDLNSMVRNWWIHQAWSIKDNILQALPNQLPLLANVSITDEEIDDCFVWKNTITGHLSLKEAFNVVVNPKPCSTWRSFPWDIDTPLAHSMIVWRFIHNKLPTDENLKIRAFSFPSLCSLCFSCCESSSHLFFECSFAKHIWNWFAGISQI